VWTLLWFAALAGILFGFMSKNETVAFASMIASLVPPVALVFLEWQEKQATAQPWQQAALISACLRTSCGRERARAAGAGRSASGSGQ
jgi:hypothetical protein